MTSLQYGSALVQGVLRTSHTVPIGLRLNRSLLPFSIATSLPSTFTLRYWFQTIRNRQELQTQLKPNKHLVLGRLADGDQRGPSDPMHLLRFIRSTNFLKKFHDVVEASKATVRAMWPVDAQAMIDSLLASGFTFPSKTVLYRCRPRFDAAAMLIERRYLNHGPWSRPFTRSGRSIYLYADSSPITGMEIFGALFDLFLVSGVCKIGHVLPGTVLGHGYVDTECKVMALLHVLWLVVGPTMLGLEMFLGDVKSFTTDSGI